MALENAVQAVDLLDDEAAPALRIDHLARMADCLGLQGDGGARERYAEVLQLAEELGDVDRQLLVLNNRSHVEMLAGEHGTALALAEQLQRLATEHGIPLHVGRLDTIARALIGLDRLDDAESALQPGRRRRRSTPPRTGMPAATSCSPSPRSASTAGVPGPAPTELLSRVDAHLYRAQGRDRVVGDIG